MRPRIASFLIGLVGALIGTGVILSAIHLWSDHIALHTIVNYLNVNATKINQLK